MVTVLGPKKKGWRQHIQKKKKLTNKQRKFHKVKIANPFLLNKIMIHHIQNSRGRLVLKITTEQPKKAFFKANYRIAEAGLLQS